MNRHRLSDQAITELREILKDELRPESYHSLKEEDMQDMGYALLTIAMLQLKLRMKKKQEKKNLLKN